MKDILDRLMTAKAEYEQARVEYECAPQGNPLIDYCIADILSQAKANYKNVIIEAINALAIELSET